MRLRSWLSRLFLACFFATSLGCIEYRLKHPGMPDRYYGWAKTHKGLDPRLGSRGKIYFTNKGSIRPYLGGNLRKNSARINLGVIYYLDNTTSLELGWRKALFEINQLNHRRLRKRDPFKDAQEIFYIGGVVRF